MITESDILVDVKVLLKITDTSQDALLNILMNSIEFKILDYCNISEIPDNLRYVWTNMTVDLYNLKYNGTSAGSGAVEQIRRGDTTIKYRSAANSGADADVNKITLDYELQLNRYRRLKVL